jgi:hypothetical protein
MEPVAPAPVEPVPPAPAPAPVEPVAPAPAPVEPVAPAPAPAPVEPVAPAPAPVEPVAPAPAPEEPVVPAPGPVEPVAPAPAPVQPPEPQPVARAAEAQPAPAAEPQTAAAAPALPPMRALPPIPAAPSYGRARPASGTQVCRIRLRQGNAQSRFLAERPEGGPPVARSVPFRLRGGKSPEDRETVKAALGGLLSELESQGWHPVARGRAPWELELRRYE